MANRYNLKNIRALLMHGFRENELRTFCFDEPDFIDVYNQLSQGIGKDEMVQLLLEHAQRKSLIGNLLTWAKECNPAKYEEYQPYHSITTRSTPSGRFAAESPRVNRNILPVNKTFFRVLIVGILGTATKIYENNFPEWNEPDRFFPSVLILLVIFVIYAFIEAKFPEDESTIGRGTLKKTIRQTTGYLIEHFSIQQLVLIAIGMIIIVLTTTWTLSEWIQNNLQLMWRLFPFYYAVGPFLYVISNRRGVAGVAHFALLAIVGQKTLPGVSFDGILLIALVSAVVMELTFNIPHSRESTVWLCVFATAFSVAATWGILTYIDQDYVFDPLQIIGGGIAGGIVFFVGELFLEFHEEMGEVNSL